METLLKQFESFIKRSMLPASVLLLVLFLFSFQDSKLYKFIEYFKLLENQNIYLTILSILVLLISLSYALSILTQFLFDNNMKQNFNSLYFYKRENEMLNLLRKKTIEKLNKQNNQFSDIEHTDYFLYQVIGRKLQFLKYPTNTKRYIDDIKSAGSIFISLLISLFIQMLLNLKEVFSYEQEHILAYLGFFFLGVVLLSIVFFVAIEYLLSKYRSRAIRLYSNYLIGEDKS